MRTKKHETMNIFKPFIKGNFETLVTSKLKNKTSVPFLNRQIMYKLVHIQIEGKEKN